MKNSTLLILFVLIQASSGFSEIDMAAPETLCERFISEAEQMKCRQKSKGIDTYAASVCQEIFDDKTFYDCIGLAAQSPVDPKQVAACTQGSMEDQDRIKCLKVLVKKSSSQFQRVPASFSKRVKK